MLVYIPLREEQRLGKLLIKINGVADCSNVLISGENKTVSDYINERKTNLLKVVVLSSYISAWASQREAQYDSKVDNT